MKVITVKTLEIISPEIQRDIHYALRMEHMSDHIFRDKKADRYSATISVEVAEEAIKTIIEKSVDIPEYTIVIDDLDMDANKFERLVIRNGKLQEKKTGSMTWEN